MNTLVWMCMPFFFFLSVVPSLSEINGCKITRKTPTSTFQFECISENMTFDSSVHSVMIYFWIENTNDEGDYILMCSRISHQEVFNCTQPNPPFKWTNSQEFCLLRRGDPNRCLKVTANNSMAVFGHYSCKSIPENTEAEKCLYSNNSKDTTELPAARQQTPMILTQTTTIRPTEKTHTDGDSYRENTLSREGNIAIIVASIVLVVVTIIACFFRKRANICRNCVFNQDSRNRKGTKQIPDVENPREQKEENVPEKESLLANTTSQCKTTYFPDRAEISSKETSVEEGAFDSGHILANKSSEKTQSFNHVTPTVVNRGCKNERLSKSQTQDQLIQDGEEAEILIKEITNDSLNDVHDAPKNKDEKDADETTGFSLEKECNNTSSTKPFVTNPKQNDLKDSVPTHLPTINHLMEPTMTGHNKDGHVNFAFTQHPNRSMKRVGENMEILHSESNETVSSATTASANDQLIKEQTDEQDLVTDSEESATSTPMFVRQSSVSVVQESEQDDLSYKDTFTLPDPLLMAEAQKILSRKYYGEKRSEVEELLKENNDVMDTLAIYASFLESGEIKNKAFEDWVQEMNTLARRRKKQLHDRMKEIRKAKAKDAVNDLIFQRARVHLNQLTIQSVTKESSNPTSAVNSVEQFNVGLREKNPTETIVTQKQDRDSRNYSDVPAIERTRVTQRGKGKSHHPDCEFNTIGNIEEELNKKMFMSVSLPRDSCDSTCTDTQNLCTSANFDNESAYCVRAGATAYRRMPTKGGRAQFQEDHANAPMEKSRLIPRLNAGSGQSVLNGNKPVSNDEEVEDPLPPLSVSTELCESSFMDVHRGGSIETMSEISVKSSCSPL